MKKAAFILTVTALMISVMSMTAFAHGHGRGHRTAPVRQTYQTYAVCEISGCELYGVHEHNGSYYCGAQHTGHGHGHRR